jgi:hypothetical protein
VRYSIVEVLILVFYDDRGSAAGLGAARDIEAIVRQSSETQVGNVASVGRRGDLRKISRDFFEKKISAKFLGLCFREYFVFVAITYFCAIVGVRIN